MTGYGQGTAEAPEVRVTVEIRSVNNRFAEVRLRLPSELSALETEIRRTVLGRIRRGRVELSLSLERVARNGKAAPLNRPLAEAVAHAARSLREELGIAGDLDLPTLLAIPGMVQTGSGWDPGDPAAREAVTRALDAALAAHDEDRSREGASLGTDLRARVARMRELAAALRDAASVVPTLARQRLQERLALLAQGVDLDPGRLAQEVAYLADRADVTEELVRLEGHLAQAARLLEAGQAEPLGKRLDFLVQEIHRETNTVNSKAADLAVSRLALDLKEETEKVREQIQNLE